MENTNSASKGYLFPLVVIGVLFFMIGFALGINGLIIPFLRTALDLTHTWFWQRLSPLLLFSVILADL